MSWEVVSGMYTNNSMAMAAEVLTGLGLRIPSQGRSLDETQADVAKQRTAIYVQVLAKGAR